MTTKGILKTIIIFTLVIIMNVAIMSTYTVNNQTTTIEDISVQPETEFSICPTPSEKLMCNDIDEFLRVWEETVPGMYKEHVCDCSDMSMYMTETLNSMGYDAYYAECHVVVEGESSVDRARINHAIVVVNMSGEMTYIETTWGTIIRGVLRDDYEIYQSYDGVSDYLERHEYKHQDIDGMEIIHTALNDM